mmetsp:Transcript_8652/g.27439  ORF Transcript_8652/g.27439 Transcript_8652/m.27439 type:complete len:610 (+) Transcript_8652:139-1968(+)
MLRSDLWAPPALGTGTQNPPARRTLTDHRSLDAVVAVVHDARAPRERVVGRIGAVSLGWRLEHFPAPLAARMLGRRRVDGHAEHAGELVRTAEGRHAGVHALLVSAEAEEDRVERHVVDAKEDERDGEGGEEDAHRGRERRVERGVVRRCLHEDAPAEERAARRDEQLAQKEEGGGDEAERGGTGEVGGEQSDRLGRRGAEGALGAHHLGVRVARERLEALFDALEAAADAAEAHRREAVRAVAAARVQAARDALVKRALEQEEGDADELERGDEQRAGGDRAGVVPQRVPKAEGDGGAAAAARRAAVGVAVHVPLGHRAADRRVLCVPHKDDEPDGDDEGDEQQVLGARVEVEGAKAGPAVGDLAAGGQQQQQQRAAAEGADGKAGACERQNQQRWQLPDGEGGDRERPRGELDLLAEAKDKEHVDGAERDKHEEGDVGGIRLRREISLLAVPHVRLHRLLPRPQPPAEHAVRGGEADESHPHHHTGEEADEQQPSEANEERHRRAASQDRPRDRQVLHRHVRQRGDQPPQFVHVLRREARAVAAAALEPFICGGGIVGVAAGADGDAEDGDGSDDVRHGGEGRVLLRETHLQHPSRRVRREAHVAVL